MSVHFSKVCKHSTVVLYLCIIYRLTWNGPFSSS